MMRNNDCTRTARLSIRLLLIGLATGFLTTIYPQIAGAQNQRSDAIMTVDGLKQRRLFRMAVDYARSALSNQELAGRERVDLTVAMLDTMAQEAYQSSDPEFWARARQEADEQYRVSQSPRKVLLAVQRVLIDQLQVERWVRELELQTTSSGSRNEGLALIAQVVTQLERLQSEVTQLLNRRPGPREESEWFKPNELLTLRYNLELQQARALQHRASFYGEGEEVNRDDALMMVKQKLDSVLKSVGPEQAVWWTAQADRISVARKLGQHSNAMRILAALPKTGAASDSRNRVNAEWIRVLMDINQLENAVEVTGMAPFASDTPALDLARVELFVAMASRSSANNPWQQRALDLTKDIEAQHGGYWGRLANLSVVGKAAVETQSNSNLDLLIRLADEAQRKKQWPEAIKALDTAYDQAVKAGQKTIAWKLGFRAASIEQDRKNHERALTRFIALAKQHNSLPDAHTAQLLACWNLTRLIGNDKRRVDEYEQALVQLVQEWPSSSSANQARIWLAAVRRSQQNWPSAIGLLLEVESASPLFTKAVADLRATIPAMNRQTDFSRESKRNLMKAIIVRLAPLVNIQGNELPDTWKKTEAHILLQLAEINSIFKLPLPEDITPHLIKLGKSEHSEFAPFVATHLFLSGNNPAFQPSRDAQISQRQLQLIYDCQKPLFAPHNQDLANEARRFLESVDKFRLTIAKLPGEQKRKWDSTTIESLVRTGKLDSAITLASQNASQNKKDAGIQIRLAELLTQQATANQEKIPGAISQWRKIAASSRKSSEFWFEAKFQIANLLSKQGQNDEALKRLKYLKAIPPGWKNAPNSEKFDELFRKLGG